MLFNTLHQGVHLFEVVRVERQSRIEISAESHNACFGPLSAQVEGGSSFMVCVLLSQPVYFILVGLLHYQVKLL